MTNTADHRLIKRKRAGVGQILENKVKIVIDISDHLSLVFFFIIDHDK